jgi:hypothetical protein
MHQIDRIGFITERAFIDQRHAVVNVGHQRVGVCRDDGKGPGHLAAGRVRYASRNVGSVRTVSHLALIGLRPPLGSLHQCGIKPQRSGSRDSSPVVPECYRNFGRHVTPPVMRCVTSSTRVLRRPTSLNRRSAKPRYNALADINLNPRASSLASDHHELHNGLQINP